MRVLTVRQPWAWAIIHGGKDVENRSRNIAGGYRGPVAIHAALKADLDALTTHDMVARIAVTKLFGAPQAWFSNSPPGHIIGVVDLVDVHPCRGMDLTAEPIGGCTPWADYSAMYHLVLANPRPFKVPIPARGKLGLWKPDADLLAQIAEARQIANDALGGES